MNNQELISGVKIIAKEKHISEDAIFEAIELGLAAAYKKNYEMLTNVRVDLSRDTGAARVFSVLKVVDELEDEDVEILIEEAQERAPEIQIGETLEEEITPTDFGRVAAGAAKQVFMQKIREAERDSITEEFGDKEDELLVGIVSHEDVRNYFIDLGRAHGILPKTEVIPGEKIKIGASLKVYVTKIDNNGKGPIILLSRRHYNFVKRLFELEIPELSDGTLLIHGVAREAGSRSKVSISSNNPSVDALGACIGEKGSRLSNVISELNGEKIDLVLYNSDPSKYIENALKPARDVNVYILNEKAQESLAVVNDDMFSLAIGKKGQNVKLAAKLTHYKIDVKTFEGAKEMGIEIDLGV